MSKFNMLAEQLDLTVLTSEQLFKLLDNIHSRRMASTKNVAFDHETLLIEGGNLDYYAGLEYNTPVETYDRGETKLYDIQEEDPERILGLIAKCQAIVDGKDPSDV